MRTRGEGDRTGKIITLWLSEDGVDDFTSAWPGGLAYGGSPGEALADYDADALHWSSVTWKDNRADDGTTPVPHVTRKHSSKVMIVNGGITDGVNAEEVIKSSAGDLVAVERPLFAYPDWPHIIRFGMPYSGPHSTGDMSSSRPTTLRGPIRPTCPISTGTLISAGA